MGFDPPATGDSTIDGMHIGEVARRTGLSVKTVRYYSDLGLVPEAERSGAGYRRYDRGALVRLEFVRTLRELGLDLATIARVLASEAELSQVAAAHAEALSAQITVLRAQRVALRALARRDISTEGVERMTRLAQATAQERRRLIDEFLDSIFDGVNVSPEFAARMRAGAPELPDDPTDAQVDAWIELADLVADPGFRDKLRAMGARSFGPAEGTGGSALPARPVTPTGAGAAETASLVVTRAGAALKSEVDPASAAGQLVADELVAAFASAVGREPSPAYRAELLDTLQLVYEPRAERYWHLIGIINGWPPVPSQLPAWDWFIAALRTHP